MGNRNKEGKLDGQWAVWKCVCVCVWLAGSVHSHDHMMTLRGCVCVLPCLLSSRYFRPFSDSYQITHTQENGMSLFVSVSLLLCSTTWRSCLRSPSVHLTFSLTLILFFFVSVSFCLLVWLFIFLFLPSSVFFLLVFLLICLFLGLAFCLSMSLSVCPSVSLSTHTGVWAADLTAVTPDEFVLS